MKDETTRFEEGVFAGAIALSRAERPAFVQRACGGDTELADRIEALLRGHELNDGALDAVPESAGSDIGKALRAQASAIGETADRIGQYHLQRKLGEGGFGVVWVAEQLEPLRRQVALKIIRPGMDSREVIARFEMERQALALMDHPNIARVFDGGATESGRPFFVMELVAGIPITRFCDEHELGTDARLQLFLQVCRAVQHAHQKGIIHRDLKPSNILVTEQDGIAVPKVIDFGIAKAVSARTTDATLVTVQAHLMGTPAYMSPEQMEIGRADIDTRSDIYNLGVLLYELLTGQMPFDAGKLSSSSFDELRQIIREQEPPKPSARVSTLDVNTRQMVARQRQTDYAKLRSTLRGDIDWIVMCCLEKERSRRYDTANGLARDIERHLHDEPITARPPTAAYILRKTMRRHRVAFTAGGAIAASLVFAVVASRIEAQRATAAEQAALADRTRAEKAREEAEAHKRAAEVVAQFMKDMLKGVGPQAAMGRDTQLLRAIAEQTAERVRGGLAGQPEVYVDLLETLGLTFSSIGDHFKGDRLLRDALAMQEKLHGRNNVVVARLLHEIGTVVDLQGASYNAELPLREAFEIRERLLPPKDPDLAATRAEFGRFVAMWQPANGEKMLRDALAVQREVHGSMNPAVAKTLIYLAKSSAGGRREEAERWAREALEINRRVFGVDAVETLEAEWALAKTRGSEQDPSGTEQLIRSIVERCVRVLGEGHPMHSNLLLNLSIHLENQKRIPEAELVAREALDLTQHYDLPGPAGQILQTVVRVMIAQGKLAELEQVVRRQITFMRPHEQDYPLMLALNLAGLTRTLRIQGRYDEAEGPAREALALRERPGADTKGWLTQSSRSSVGAILTKLGKFAEAEALLLSAYDGLIEIDREFPTRTSDYFRGTYVALVDLYQQWGRAEERGKWYTRALAFIEELRRKNRPAIANQLETELKKLSTEGDPVLSGRR
jgi:eukaryotic-like serine/threonine-protein kinase